MPDDRTTRASTERDRPIIFSAPMVRAILDGRKTQTRRLVRGNGAPLTHVSKRPTEGRWWGEPGGWIACPYGAAGDRLWLRETFHAINAKRAPWASNPWVFVIEFRRVT